MLVRLIDDDLVRLSGADSDRLTRIADGLELLPTADFVSRARAQIDRSASA